MISEFERRFDTAQRSVMHGIQALNLASEHLLDMAHINPFAEAYNADITDLQHELYQAKRLIERATIKYEWDTDAAKPAICEKPPTSPVSFIAFIARYGDAFHELHGLGRIAITLPVSTASCERSFSALRHIKTWVRNSMTNSRLSSVALLAIERERALSLNNEKVIDVFAVAHKNRRIALM